MTSGEPATLNEQVRALCAVDPARAAAIAEEAIAKARASGERVDLAEALCGLGESRQHMGLHREAREPLAEAVHLLEELPRERALLARAHHLLLRSHFVDQEHERALEHGRLALAAARESGDASWESAALNDLGLVYADLGAFGVGLENLLDSIGLLERNGRRPGGSPLNNVGNIYMLMEQPEAALRFFVRAREAFLAEGSTRGQVTVLGNLGRAYEALDDLAQALPCHEEAVRLARSLGDTGNLAPALTKLGTVIAKQDDLDTAIELFDEALAIYERFPNAFRNETLFALAAVRLERGESEEACSLYRTVLREATEHGNREMAAGAHQGISSSLEAVGDWQGALEHYKAYHALRHELDRELFSSRSRALLMQHEMEQTEREQRLLRERNKELEEANAQLRELQALLEEQAVELERLSLEDPLTGLANRRAFERYLNGEIARCRRFGGTFSIIMCDIDRFKSINDRYSHEVGDTVLVRVGSLLLQSVRSIDMPARIGGEEFVVLLPSTSLDGAVLAAGQIARSIRAHPWKDLHPGLVVTMSVGVAEFHEGQGASDLLREADVQLYRAKREGRDRVCYPGPRLGLDGGEAS